MLRCASGEKALTLEAKRNGRRENHRLLIPPDLEATWEVLAEAVQTVLRRHGVTDAYEQLKALTRGRAVTREELHEFIESAPIPAAERARLRALTPAAYIGKAAELARKI